MKRFLLIPVSIALFNMFFVIDVVSGQTGSEPNKIILSNVPVLSSASSSESAKGEGTLFFSDDFDSYESGQQLACQNPFNWTTWNHTPCTSTDAYIVDTYSNSAPNSVNISGGNSIVNKFGNNGHGFNTGKYKISFSLFVPAGQKALWKLLYNYEFNASTAMEVSMEDGVGSLSVEDNADLATFNYDSTGWIFCEVYVSLNDDVAKLVIDNNTVSAWKWSGNTNLNRLSGINFNGNLQSDVCNYYIDNFKLEKHNFPFPGTTPPENLDVDLLSEYALITWDYVSPYSWIEWDDGANGDDGIGLTGGGSFYVASHWYPDDLSSYNGFYINKIKYYHYENAPTASFVVKVWQGENAGTLLLSQNVESSFAGQWNEVVLDNPVQIDASQELWFGYEVTHPDQENPAGVDAGPAIQYKGDMLSFDGNSWVSISAEYGLDFNWNLAAYVTEEPGVAYSSIPLVKNKVNENKFAAKSTLLSYYKIYLNFDGQGYELLDTITEPPYYYYGGNFWYLNCFYVTAVYENYFESEPSNEDCEIITADSILLNTNQYMGGRSLNIYPNPATDIVNIKSNSSINEIKVYNYAGQIVDEIATNEFTFKLNTSQYKPGIYFIRNETDGGIVSKRIVIK